MLTGIKKWMIGALAVIGLGTCAACTQLGDFSETASVVQEDCLTLDEISREAICLLGTYAIAVDELAEAREAGEIPADIEPYLDVAINEVTPRAEAAALAWGAVIGYKEVLDAGKNALDEGNILEVANQLQIATAEAATDWVTLRPKLIQLVTLNESVKAGETPEVEQ